MSKYLSYSPVDLSDFVSRFGLDHLSNHCNIYVGRTSPINNGVLFKFTKLSELMRLYSHMIYHVEMTEDKPSEIWIADRSMAEIARAEGSPIKDWDVIDSSLALEIAHQKELENNTKGV